MGRSIDWARLAAPGDRELPRAVASAARGIRRGAISLIVVAPCAACVSGGGGLVYSGSGLLTVSGATAPLIGAHVAIARRCPPEAVYGQGYPQVVRWVDSFDVLALGSRCVMDGTSFAADFRPDYGTTCSLRFAEGMHTLQVTDVSLHYGIFAAPYGPLSRGGVWTDPSVLLIEIGGNDVTTGARAVYHFSGTAVDTASVFPSCDDERAKRIAAAAARAPRSEPDLDRP
ncbi:MAG TPA: hypothetical protein VEK07_14485 [Polyangiaceae bacterium]|nr:hypothetical protein [Polyangiaceae bacterium]